MDEHAEVEREQAIQFLKYLRTCEGFVCLPVIKTSGDHWAMQILMFAMQLENELCRILQNLRTTASEIGENYLFDFVGMFLEEQTKRT